jgi:pyridoxine 4-dehydrogenase
LSSVYIEYSTVYSNKVKLSKIGLGTWAWGNRLLWQYDKSEDPELLKAYQFAIQNGINWFDTADSYGTGSLSGRSEELLGQFNAKSSNNNVYFCTKLAPYPWRIGSSSMMKAANQSITRLGRPIDILQLHWPPSLQWQEKEYLEGFSQVVKTGQATQIGLSNYGPKGLKRAAKILSNYGQKPYTNQVKNVHVLYFCYLMRIYQIVYVHTLSTLHAYLGSVEFVQTDCRKIQIYI